MYVNLRTGSQHILAYYLCLVLLQVPKTFVTKSLIAFSVSSKTFVLAQNLLNKNERKYYKYQHVEGQR
jgi:hypothetical protein